MANSNIELSLMDAEEKQQLEYIWNLIPAEDRQGMTQADVLMVLDLMDDYLVSQGLLEEEDNTDDNSHNQNASRAKGYTLYIDCAK